MISPSAILARDGNAAQAPALLGVKYFPGAAAPAAPYAGAMQLLSHPELEAHRDAIVLQAEHEGLPPVLVAAIVMVESSGETYAFRPEPYYRWLWDVRRSEPFRLTGKDVVGKAAPKDFPSMYGSRDAEWWGQQASWGLMQVMGAVARERGLDPRIPLTVLCDPTYGLSFGCAHLAALRDRNLAEHGWVGVVAAYNAGSVRHDRDGGLVNQVYVDKVSTLINLERLP